eukprot:2407592-Rhodomonas_salina.3
MAGTNLGDDWVCPTPWPVLTQAMSVYALRLATPCVLTWAMLLPGPGHVPLQGSTSRLSPYALATPCPAKGPEAGSAGVKAAVDGEKKVEEKKEEKKEAKQEEEEEEEPVKVMQLAWEERAGRDLARLRRVYIRPTYVPTYLPTLPITHRHRRTREHTEQTQAHTHTP